MTTEKIAPQPVPEIPPLDVAGVLAGELTVPRRSVEATLALLKDGATIPFLARYRKEQTGGLDEVQLQKIKDRGEELAEIEARRRTIVESIASQGKLTDALTARILGTLSRTELEDLYLPYRPKRRTRAMIARERGLEPLADLIWTQAPTLDGPPEKLAAPFVSAEREVPDVEAAWQGARDIVAERIADQADVRASLRQQALAEGAMRSQQIGEGNDPERLKYKDYFDYEEPVKLLPSHRILALRRGEKEGFLRVKLAVDEETAVGRVRQVVLMNPRAALRDQLETALQDSYDRLLQPSIEVDVRLALKERADAEAIRVFAENLRHLLLAAPLGGKRMLALDPGFRTGCKVVALDETGALLEHTVVYPHEPQRQVEAARKVVAGLVAKHRLEAIAIGNGTAGRESETFARAMKKDGLLPDGCLIVSVNESGASVYSASEVAREEFPNEDVTVRGAVSIGRRLQDPLAELVKIDPKSIGVGQYQHDVSQSALGKALDAVVESCVNGVGVEVNTASAKLLSYVAGVGETVAKNIVAYRTEHGPFRSRAELKKVPRLGPKAFEQAAGFLRIRGGAHPLDGSAVHPESYDVVERIARDLGVGLDGLVGRPDVAKKIEIRRYVDERRGEPTLRDIVAELEKPGRDPRQSFEALKFREDVTELEHLQEGMILEGAVTNVTAFGAFVDVGVHQDGLVHVSELAHRFVKDPAEVVKVGDRVKVKVTSIDKARRRIGLSIKQASAPPTGAQPHAPSAGAPGSTPRERPRASAPTQQRPSGPPPQASTKPGELRHNPFSALRSKRS